MDPEAGRAEALDCYWDEVVTGRASSPAFGVDPVAVGLLWRLRLLGADPDPADVEIGVPGLRGAGQETTEGGTIATTAKRIGSGGYVGGDRATARGGGRGMPHGRVARVAWPAAHLATAALVLGTVAAAVVAFDPGRPERLPGEPSGAAVIGPALATPAPSTAGVVEFLWDTTGDPGMPLREPGPVAIDPAGSLWIPDGAHDRFLIFAPDGRFLEAWGTPGSGEGEFEFSDAVYGGIGFGEVAFDDAGNLYVADTGNHRIQKFGPDRAFIAAWGSEGAGAGQFRRLTSIAVDRTGRVYASDNAWGKIEVFDTDGDWIETWTGLETPTGIAIEADGNVLIADIGAGVLRFSSDGERLATLSRFGSGEGEFLSPNTLAVDAAGRIHVGDLDTDRIQIIAPDGTFLGGWGGRGDGPGEFHYPQGIAIGADGTVYVNDDAGDRLQAFRLLPPLGPAASPEP